MSPTHVGWRRIPVVQLLVVAVLVALAGFEFRRLFETEALVLPVLTATIAPIGVIVVLHGLRRTTLGIAVVANLAAFVVGATLVLARDDLVGGLPTPATLRSLGRSLVDGWHLVLTTTLPAADEPALLATAFVTTWVSATAAATLLVRTRAPLAPVAPPAMAIVVAAVLGGGGDAQPALNAAFVGSAAILVLVRASGSNTHSEHRVRSRRRLALGLPIVAVVALGALVVGPLLPFAEARQPYDPRSTPPLGSSGETLSPLADLQAIGATEPSVELFTVRVEPESSRISRWRRAVLDTYDGADWSSDARYRPTGEILPREETGVLVDVVRQEVQLPRPRASSLTGPWLPLVDRAVEITGTDFRFDPRGDVAVADRGAIDGLRYEVTSEVPRFDSDDLHAAVPDNNPAFAPLLRVPDGVPPVLLDAAEDVVTPAASRFQELALLQRYFADNPQYFVYAPEALPGHSFWHLERFFADAGDGAGGPAVGSVEQFVTAFAVAARWLGFPTRIAVGFRATPSRASGAVTVTSADAYAWPEVALEGLGWVAFDPVPLAEGDREPEADDRDATELAAAEAETVVVAGAQAERGGRGAGGGGGGEAAATFPHTNPTSPLSRWAVRVGTLLAGLAAAALGVVIAMKVGRRRSRRRAPTAARRIVGAWQDSLDRLADAGVTRTETMTVPEVVDVAVDTTGPGAAGHLRPLGTLVNVALFERIDPTPEEADLAWRHADGFRAELRLETSRRTRIRWMLSLRSLRRRRYHDVRGGAIAFG